MTKANMLLDVSIARIQGVQQCIIRANLGLVLPTRNLMDD